MFSLKLIKIFKYVMFVYYFCYRAIIIEYKKIVMVDVCPYSEINFEVL